MAQDKMKIPPPLPPVLRKSLESGLITRGAVSENRMPESACLESTNFDFDAIGSATVRKGLTRLGNQLTGNILGMHYFVDTVNTVPKSQFLVVNGNTAYYLNSGGTYSSCRGSLTIGSKARFSTYLNFAFMVNGTEATAVWDGTTGTNFVTTGNAASAPIGKFIENFRSRMWIMGDPSYPSRLYYSSIPSSVVTPVITWSTDPATGQWIDISPSDGDFPTALQRFRNKMLVFKTNRIYRVFDIGQVDPDPYYAVGTSSQESVVETKAGVFFHHASGFYQYDIYDIVQEVSRPIIDIIRAIPASSYPSIVGWVEPDGDHICWSVGTVTVRGITYTNLVVRFTISTQVWTTRTYPTQFLASLRRQPLYTDGTTQFALVGDTAGNVYETNTGLTDDGASIPYSLIHRWDDIDGMQSTRKNANIGNFLHYGGTGSTVAYQTEEQEPSDLNNWTNKVGTLQTINTGFTSMDIKGRKMRFRIFGQSSGQPFTYNGYELLYVSQEYLQFPQD